MSIYNSDTFLSKHPMHTKPTYAFLKWKCNVVSFSNKTFLLVCCKEKQNDLMHQCSGCATFSLHWTKLTVFLSNPCTECQTCLLLLYCSISMHLRAEGPVCRRKCWRMGRVAGGRVQFTDKKMHFSLIGERTRCEKIRMYYFASAASRAYPTVCTIHLWGDSDWLTIQLLQ